MTYKGSTINLIISIILVAVIYMPYHVQALGENCTTVSDCPSQGERCDNGQCSCDAATHYKNGNNCIQKGTNGGACLSTVGDSSCLYFLNCINDVCQCSNSTTQYFDTDYTCKQKGTHNQPCSTAVDPSCLYLLKCSNNICQCTDPGTQYFDTTTNTCKQKGTHNQTCSSAVGNSSCLYLLKCPNNICQCQYPTTQYFDTADNTCKQKGIFGGTCSSAVGNVSCLDSLQCTNDVCACTDPATQYFETNTCKQKGTHNQACSTAVGDSSCLHSLKCVNNICQCSSPATQYFDTANSTCKQKGTHNQPCATAVGDTSCLYSLKCPNNICQCEYPATQYFDTDNTVCKQKGTHNEACSTSVGDTSCLHSLKCTNDICQCEYPTTQYFDTADNTCKQKKVLGDTCTASIQCIEANSECTTKCQCQLNFYDTNNDGSGGSCQPLTNLRVDDLKLTTRSETFLLFEWKALLAASAIEYYAYQIGGNVAVSVGKELKANITGLTPGTSYTINIISVDTNSRPLAHNTSVQITEATIPAIPGPIDTGSSDLHVAAFNKQITIKWKPSAGVVNYYSVTVNDSNLNPSSLNPSSAQATFSNALNGKRYLLTLKAYSNNLGSKEYTEIFRTQVTQPQAPTLLNCQQFNIFSTSMSIRWSEPAFPNGDILYYLVNTVSGVNAPGQINTTTNVLVQKVDGLVEAREYCFTVKTVNDGDQNIRESVVSNKVCCSTIAGVATPPTNVTIFAVQSRSFRLQWYKPADPKGKILAYRLRLLVNNVCKVEVVFQCTDCGALQTSSYKCGEELGDNRKVANINSTEANSMVHYTLENLLPFTSYQVWLAVINDIGDGEHYDTTVHTDSQAPGKPVSVQALVKSATEITVTWDLPGPRPGITNYTVQAKEILNDQTTNVAYKVITGFDTKTVDFTGLEEYWTYTFVVTANTDKGSGPPSDQSLTARTYQAAPGMVENLRIKNPPGTFTQIEVTWSIPLLRNRNGVIVDYNLEHNITGVTPYTMVIPATNFQLSQTLTVKTEEYYMIVVYAVNNESQNGIKNESVYYAKPGPPETPSVPAVVEGAQSIVVTSQTTITVKLTLDWFLNEDNGKRTDGGVLVCPGTACTNYGKNTGVKSSFTTVYTWKQSKKEDFSKPYRATNTSWVNDHRDALSGRRKRSNQEVTLTIGEDTNCDKMDETVYCNGPLPAGKSFIVVAFVCTSGGCTESEQFGPYATQAIPDDSAPIAAIGGAVGGAVVVVVVIVIVMIVIRRTRNKNDRMDPVGEDDLDPIGKPVADPVPDTKNIKKNRPIRMDRFADHVEDLHRDSNLKFAHEYEDIKALTDPKLLKGVTLAETEDNKLKNRYVNILPYDRTIVKLLPLEDDDENSSTFINANYIRGYNSQREYIASQGPIPSTIDDFWRMIWEQNVSIIVMLTLCKEEGRIKCECYWPTDQSDPKQYGDIVVEMKTSSTINTFDYKIFDLSVGDRTRTVKHFHFLNWKDFQANVQNDVMIDFIHNVRNHVTVPESRVPMVVHCSAGVGRTGTYIALDHLMQYIHEHNFSDEIDIFDLVVKMRECRMYMVQTEQQYIFIHDCIKDILERKRIKELEGEGNLYGNEDMYANSQTQENIYDNQAFEPDVYQNVDLKGSEQRSDL